MLSVSVDKETEGDRHQTLGGSKISNKKREKKNNPEKKKKMNGGSDDFDNLEHTYIPEAVYSQEGFSNYPSLPLMGSSIEDYLRLSNMSPADLPNNNHASEKAEMGIDLQTQMGFDSQQDYNSHLMQEPLYKPHIPLQQFNWADSIDGIQGMKIYNHQQQQDRSYIFGREDFLFKGANLRVISIATCLKKRPSGFLRDI